MFRPADKPAYKPGLSGVLGVFCGALGLTVYAPFLLYPTMSQLDPDPFQPALTPRTTSQN
jgi:hypothetical protein